MTDAAIRPNFFLIGAPRCGTTALCEYLKTHPQVCLSRPKEPHFFATDLPHLRHVVSEREYLHQVFGHATPAHRAVGEASVFYYASRDAVPNILRFQPEARILLNVRNPIEMVQSLHHQQLYRQVEDEPDFATAWHLQAERRAGRRIPRRCRTPLLLQYAELGRLGAHVERVMGLVPAHQLRVVVFDDLTGQPLRTYREVLAFLALDDDGRREFPVSNPRRMQSRWFRSLLGGLPRPVEQALVRARRALGVPELQLRRRIGELTARPVAYPPLELELRIDLAECFRDDVEKLSALLGRDLTGWLAAPEAAR